MEYIVLVDEADREIGYEEKLSAHKKSLLHRAFSIFILSEETGKILIQCRAKGKYHSGGLWTNSCCSHQRKGETMNVALSRCIKDELCAEIDTEKKISDGKMVHLGKFTYLADFGELAEHEIDNVFALYLTPTEIENLSPSPEEIEEIKWLSVHEIDSLYERSPEKFTAWFYKAYTFIKEHLK